jgi:hypothetical protein
LKEGIFKMVDPSLDFSGRGRNLPSKKMSSMVEGSLDFSGRGRKISQKQPKRTLDSSLDFVALGRAKKQNGGGVRMLGPSLDFVAQGRQQTQNIANMVEKSTGIPMVKSLTKAKTGKGKKKKEVQVKKFAKPEAKTGIKGKQAAASVDLKSIISGIKKFNEKGVGLGKSLRKGKKQEKRTRTEKALDEVLEKSQVKKQSNIELSADQLTQRRLRQLIDEEKAKKKGFFKRFRR